MRSRAGKVTRKVWWGIEELVRGKIGGVGQGRVQQGMVGTYATWLGCMWVDCIAAE